MIVINIFYFDQVKRMKIKNYDYVMAETIKNIFKNNNTIVDRIG